MSGLRLLGATELVPRAKVSRHADQGPAGALPLSGWLAHQGLTLEELRLVQHVTPHPGRHVVGSKAGHPADKNANWTLVGRVGAEQDALDVPAHWGWASAAQ